MARANNARTDPSAATPDLTDATSTAAACRDADVVVMAAQVPYPRWTTELPRLVDRQLKGAREVVAQFDRPYLIDAGAFEATFRPFETTPHEVAIADTVAWLQQDQPVPV